MRITAVSGKISYTEIERFRGQNYWKKKERKALYTRVQLFEASLAK